MNKTQITTAAIFGFLGVALGAFGAHGLKNLLGKEMTEIYRTGVLYHLIHSVVLLALSLSSYNFVKSFVFIAAGILLFSFSLYVYAITGITFIAMITPIGGVSFLIGWILIIFEARNSYNN